MKMPKPNSIIWMFYQKFVDKDKEGYYQQIQFYNEKYVVYYFK